MQSRLLAISVLCLLHASLGLRGPRLAPQRRVSPRTSPISASLDLGTLLFEAQLSAEAAVSEQLSSLSPASAFVLYGAGLLTSLSPCCLSMLPLTMSYIGSGTEEGASLDQKAVFSSFGPALAFATGLACSFSALGITAASAGAMLGGAMYARA